MENESNEKLNLFQSLFKSIGNDPSADVPSFIGSSTALDLDLRFAENFNSNDGKFIYCKDVDELFSLLCSLQEQMEWNYFHTTDATVQELFKQFKFQEGEEKLRMEDSDAGVTQCFSLLANEGLVLLSPDQATSRRLTNFPNHHIIIASNSQLNVDLEQGLLSFKEQFLDKLPSLIELDENLKVCKANHARLLHAKGTPNVYVFYVDVPSFEE